jgi:hypothetical protein
MGQLMQLRAIPHRIIKQWMELILHRLILLQVISLIQLIWQIQLIIQRIPPKILLLILLLILLKIMVLTMSHRTIKQLMELILHRSTLLKVIQLIHLIRPTLQIDTTNTTQNAT